MNEKEKNEQPQPQNRDEELEEEKEKDAAVLPDREAMSRIGGETQGLGPPVP